MSALQASAQTLGTPNFLQGFVKACQHPASYEQFQQSLCKGKQDGTCGKGTVILPENWSGSITKFEPHPEYTLFEVKLTEPLRFEGATVNALEVWRGHENGIVGSALILAEKTTKEVGKKFKLNKTKIQTIKSELGNQGAQVVVGKDKRVRVMCDLSN